MHFLPSLRHVKAVSMSKDDVLLNKYIFEASFTLTKMVLGQPFSHPHREIIFRRNFAPVKSMPYGGKV